MKAERIEELREFVQEESQWGIQGERKKQRDGYFKDLLSLLDEKAEQIKAGASAKAGERGGLPTNSIPAEEGATPSPGLSAEDDGATVRRRLSDLDFLVEMREKEHGDGKRYRESLRFLSSRLAAGSPKAETDGYWDNAGEHHPATSKPAPPAEIITDEKARELLTEAGYIDPPASGEEERLSGKQMVNWVRQWKYQIECMTGRVFPPVTEGVFMEICHALLSAKPVTVTREQIHKITQDYLLCDEELLEICALLGVTVTEEEKP